MQLPNTSPFNIGRARTATARLLAVGLVAATLSVAAFGLGSLPSGPVSGGAVTPTAGISPQPFVITKHYDKSTPVLGKVTPGMIQFTKHWDKSTPVLAGARVLHLPDIDPECVCKPHPQDPIL